MNKDAKLSLAEKVERNTLMIPEATCWYWVGTVHHRGYGMVGHENKRLLAHRAAYEVAHGQIADGLLICHHCDNPLCVRPDHLFAGTPLDNMLDKVRKGRQSKGASHSESIIRSERYAANRLRGEQHPGNKLTADQRRAILAQYQRGGVTQRALAQTFGVSQALVSSICKPRSQ